MLLPDAEVRVAKVLRRPERVYAEGFVRAEPSAVHRSLVDDPDHEVHFSDDEGFEAEALVSDGEHRTFWKVTRSCRGGSRFVALVSREPGVRR
jgi:hypothetical protein